ncbi:hypothetical protein GALL_412320 [mine drainage metagenome]|uniref:Uncharacterized protein n=1 Tax=mine drainage metagenome TaxID=410659 RepID=A0A1J5QM31_9ZZZZ
MLLCPAYLTVNDLANCLRFAHQLTASPGDSVQVDASALRFIDPFGLTLLAAASERVGQSGGRVDVIRLSPTHGGYLQRMNFSQHPWMQCSAGQQTVRRQDQRASLVELRRLTTEREVDAVANALAVSMLGQVPGLYRNAPQDDMTGCNDWDRSHEPLCHVLTELLQNALTHARRDGHGQANVWVAAQYMRKTDRIHLGITDTGCGFLASLRSHPRLTSATDEAAMLLALQPRISCNRDFGLMPDSVNAGIGLTTTFRIVRNAQGRMTMVSGDGVVQTENGADPATAHARAHQWQGVAIGLDCSRQALLQIRIRELMPPREFGRDAPVLRFI